MYWCFLAASLESIKYFVHKTQTVYDKNECLELVLSALVFHLVNNNAKNVAMVCFRSVYMWNRDSHTVMHTDHLNFVVVVVLWFFPSSGMYAVLFIYLLYSAYLH